MSPPVLRQRRHYRRNQERQDRPRLAHLLYRDWLRSGVC